MRLVFAFAAWMGLAQLAWATDQITCTSATFNASFAVGSDGYVTYMALADKSARYFSEPLEITDMEKDHRRVSVAAKAVDVEAALGLKKAKSLVIQVRKGRGYINLDSRKETMSCDWAV